VGGKLEGKVALVTGGSSGIGLATAELFAEEGAHVYVTGRRTGELSSAVEKIGARATGIRCDVSRLEELDGVFLRIQAERGALDTVFANAGGGTFLPLGAITETQYRETFDTNVKGVIFTVQKALPLLRDGATIVLNASTAASRSIPAFSVYSATKAAVRNLARAWARDLGTRRIRVNAVSPGVVVTPGYKLMGLTEEQINQFASEAASTIPLGRTGKAEEIARAVLFLASSDSSFVNAAELVVDGGQTQV
jgi:NAD(P)-dependent dehydrogenase (short-subunit alcohol dehydrogenase family)